MTDADALAHALALAIVHTRGSEKWLQKQATRLGVVRELPTIEEFMGAAVATAEFTSRNLVEIPNTIEGIA